jgi:hypothetical protein
MFGKDKKPRKVSRENYFTSYIMRGSRQILKAVIKSSKKFTLEHDTYFIKRNCIITRIQNGKLESVCYYSEGNPNPHDFKSDKVNTGLTYDEFNELYGEDMYDILIRLQRDTKTIYLIALYVAVLISSLFTFTTSFF